MNTPEIADGYIALTGERTEQTVCTGQPQSQLIVESLLESIVIVQAAFIDCSVVELDTDKGAASPTVPFFITEDDIGRLRRFGIIAADVRRSGDLVHIIPQQLLRRYAMTQDIDGI